MGDGGGGEHLANETSCTCGCVFWVVPQQKLLFKLHKVGRRAGEGLQQYLIYYI